MKYIKNYVSTHQILHHSLFFTHTHTLKESILKKVWCVIFLSVPRASCSLLISKSFNRRYEPENFIKREFARTWAKYSQLQLR